MLQPEAGRRYCVALGATPPVVCLAVAVRPVSDTRKSWWFDTYVGPGTPTRLMFGLGDIVGVPSLGLINVGEVQDEPRES